MSNKTFSHNGSTISLPFYEIGGYHYVRIEKENILNQFPIVAKAQNLLKAPPNWVTWHWTAAPYDVPFNHYQINVGEEYVYVNLYMTDYEFFSHTWMRNGKNIGISYMAMGGVPTNGMYPQDIRKVPGMIETGSRMLAALIHYFGLKPTNITDHAAWAAKDGYPGQRWDNQLVLPSGKTLFTTNVTEAFKIASDFYQEKKTIKVPVIKENLKTESIKKAGDVCMSDTPYNDVNKSMWFADSVQKVTDLGIMSGRKTEDRGLVFDPEQPLTRAEFAVAAEKLLKYLGK